MTALYLFLIRNYLWIVLVCVLGIAWYAVQLVQSVWVLRRSAFRLERERATADRTQALLWLLLLGALGGFVAHVNVNVRPSLPAELLLPPTPTPDFIATAIVAAPVQVTPRASIATPTPLIAPTATLRDPGSLNQVLQQGEATPLPELTVDPTVDGCTGRALIRVPASGTTVAGGVSVFGRAAGDGFGSYELGLRGPETLGNWQIVEPLRRDVPVEDGFLVTIDLSAWESGIYELRLLVLDANAEELDRCVIQLGLVR